MGGLNMLEKLGGFIAIVVAATGLALISVFEPPTFVQIICALVGSFLCLIGIVILFSEGQIWTKDRRGKTVPKAA
jgi:H+/gluconate symporter-like permease